MMNKYYRKVLNEPVPMLGSISPRDAARTRSGRAKLVEWLKHLEQGSSTHQTDGNPLGSYDFGWMWTELGIENLRT
jgi:cytochrome b